MSDLQLIQEALQRTARRWRWLQAWRGLGQGAFAGASLWFLAVAIYKLCPISLVMVVWAGYAALGCLVAGALYGWWRKRSLLQTARWVDEQQQLKERLSTALEICGNEQKWSELVLADAAHHAKAVDPSRLVPFKVPILTRWALGMLALGVGLGFIPEYRSHAFKQRQAEAAQIRKVGEHLSEVTRQNLEQRPPVLMPTRQSMDEVLELGELLTHAKLTRSEALRELTSATEKLREQTEQLGDQNSLKPLERAAREPGGTTAAGQDLQNQVDALQKALGHASSDPNKLDDLQQKLQKLQQNAANLPSQDSAAGRSAREQLAQALSQLAQEAKDVGASLPNLEEAIAALQNDQTDLMLRDLQAAMHDLEKLRDMARSVQQLQQQMARLGKDLAEQLQHGQIEAAQNTLQKMVGALQSPNLSEEQLKKILEEVSQALDPAGEYGRVAELLKQAVQQMKQGQNPGAAQSLADAAAELAKLKQQLQDVQSLMAALDALNQAQNAISLGKSWEQCKGGYCSVCGGAGCNACRAKKGTRWGHGGRPSAGVGTWADETGWTYYPQEQQPVDNSGVVRPDLDPRGHADRPDDLNPNLNPTKVRGQMSPGSSMPSITLKGVHIKGQSTVQYEEAVATAQAEMQSALNQDKVPRPYLNAVRDYFDDMKK
jgi:hypothetical protein